jgi:hypothetical protein
MAQCGQSLNSSHHCRIGRTPVHQPNTGPAIRPYSEKCPEKAGGGMYFWLHHLKNLRDMILWKFFTQLTYHAQ